MSSTKSVVLSCAGIGSRLGLGQTKALLKIHGESLISWQIKFFDTVEDLRIVVGYQANEVIKEVLKYRKNVIFVYNHNYFETKTGASYYLGAKDANKYVIEWDGDLIVHPDDVRRCLEKSGEFIAYSNISSKEGVYVNTSKIGNVTAFSRSKGDYEWTGPASLLKNKIKNTSEHVFNQIEPYLPLPGLKIRAQDIDTYEDYQNALKLINRWTL